ncbi:hypothetical protein C8R43DRAFT_981582 [Mycena crocata]|nr:hypothetical protein C8R43DRAFT_981582 [Mycena crocata]
MPRAARTASRALSTSAKPTPVYFESPAGFGLWLAKHHATESECWVGYYKKHTGRQALTWSLAVDEALCWGWIDGIKKTVDSERTMQRFTPRKAKSHWSKVNVAKVAVLEAAGRMEIPGKAAFALRTEENTGQMSHEREANSLSEDFVARLAKIPLASQWHAKQPPGYRRDAENWVMSAKQEATRERRLGLLIESAEEGLRVPPLRR